MTHRQDGFVAAGYRELLGEVGQTSEREESKYGAFQPLERSAETCVKGWGLWWSRI